LKKIVIVSGFRVFPVSSGGQVRTSSIARMLARMGYDVLIYSVAGRRADYALGRTRSYRIDQIEPRLVEETNLSVSYGLMQALARKLNQPRYWLYVMLSRGLVPRRLRSALREADAVISDFSYCPRVPGPWAHKPWYLLSHQLEHRLLQQEGSGKLRFVERMRRVEARGATMYTDIFACAEEDRDFYQAQDGAGRMRIPIIRCGVDARVYAAAPGVREQLRAQLGLGEDDRLLVFSGSDFLPNRDALARLKTFARAEAPFLARERVYFLLLGSMEPTPYRDGALIATSRVPEVVPYFAAADAGLNPITLGTGANVKLFEYLASRLPVLSTQFVVRGTALEPEVDFLPYSPEDPKVAILRFLRERSPAQWREFAEQVWARHRSYSDIEESVRAAAREAQGFPPP